MQSQPNTRIRLARLKLGSNRRLLRRPPWRLLPRYRDLVLRLHGKSNERLNVRDKQSVHHFRQPLRPLQASKINLFWRQPKNLFSRNPMRHHHRDKCLPQWRVARRNKPTRLLLWQLHCHSSIDRCQKRFCHLLLVCWIER